MMSGSRIRLAIAVVVVGAQAFGRFAQAQAGAPGIAEGERLRAIGNYQEAERAFVAALREAEQRHAPNDYVAAILADLGVTEIDLGKWLDAERLLARSLSLHVRTAGPNGRATIGVKTHLGQLYLLEDRPRESATLLSQVLGTLRADPASDPIDVAKAMRDLAVARALERKYRESEALRREALAKYEDRLGADSYRLTDVLNPLVGLLTARHRYAEATIHAERAWRITRASGNASATIVTTTMASLAYLYLLAGRAEEAEFYAKEAATRAEAARGLDNLYAPEWLRVYAAVLKRLNRKDEAKAVEERAKALLSQKARNNPGRYTISANALIR